MLPSKELTCLFPVAYSCYCQGIILVCFCFVYLVFQFTGFDCLFVCLFVYLVLPVAKQSLLQRQLPLMKLSPCS